GIDRGLRPDGVPVQHDLEPVQGQAGRQQSLEGHHAGVANTRNPAGAWQLGQGATCGLSLGLRLQRARRQGGFRAAKPAGGRTRRLGNRAVSITILFVLAPIGAIIAWWLSRQRLMSKPWLEVGAIDDVPRTDALSLPAATIGLGVFLAVVSSLFALFVSAYLMRMQVADWAQLPAPRLLWFNTGVLILSSVGLQYAQVAARRGRMEAVAGGLIAGGLFALVFLVGQRLAWQQLNAAGYFLAANPANAFFYLFTGLHGLHLLGGLMALGMVADKVWRGFEVKEVRLSVQLCAVYWHFLLAL